MQSHDDPMTEPGPDGQSRFARRKALGRIAVTCEFDARTYDRLVARRDVEERSLAAIVRAAVREYADRVEAADARNRARLQD